MSDSKEIYESILTSFPDAITPAVNIFLVLENIRPAFQYDYFGNTLFSSRLEKHGSHFSPIGNIIDRGPLDLAMALSANKLKIIDKEEPIVILKSNIHKLNKCSTMGELLGYQYTNNDWSDALGDSSWFFGYSLNNNCKLFSDCKDVIMNQYAKYIVYGYIIPKNKYTKKISDNLHSDLNKINKSLETISLEVYPFFITLGDIYIKDGALFGIPLIDF